MALHGPLPVYWDFIVRRRAGVCRERENQKQKLREKEAQKKEMERWRAAAQQQEKELAERAAAKQAEVGWVRPTPRHPPCLLS